MGDLISVYTLIKAHMPEIIAIIAHLCLAASVVIKLTPTIKDDNYWKPFIKFVGKYIAFDKYGPPKTNG